MKKNEHFLIANVDRAFFARRAVDAYSLVKERRPSYDVDEDMAADLLCDLLHFIRSVGADPNQKLQQALSNFEAEESGDEA
jgi:hypothetical protein